jgi:hypothetical protein
VVAAHDRDARRGDAGALGDQPAKGVVGAAVDRRRRDPCRIGAIAPCGNLLARGARGEADADVGALGQTAIVARGVRRRTSRASKRRLVGLPSPCPSYGSLS